MGIAASKRCPASARSFRIDQSRLVVEQAQVQLRVVEQPVALLLRLVEQRVGGQEARVVAVDPVVNPHQADESRHCHHGVQPAVRGQIALVVLGSHLAG